MARRIPVPRGLAAALLLTCGCAFAQTPATPSGPAATPLSRGQLLYDTHCIGCHNTLMHWRDRRLASSWSRLVALVDHWQKRELLNWSYDDVLEVSRHLNDTVYRLPRPSEIGALPAGPRS